MREKRREIKLPVEAFTICPSCCSANYLHQMSIDVYCHGCGRDTSSRPCRPAAMVEVIRRIFEKVAIHAQRVFFALGKHSVWIVVELAL